MDDLETYTINIERGVKYEEKITQPNAARDYVEKSASDLKFVIKEAKHSFFIR